MIWLLSIMVSDTIALQMLVALKYEYVLLTTYYPESFNKNDFLTLDRA